MKNIQTPNEIRVAYIETELGSKLIEHINARLLKNFPLDGGRNIRISIAYSFLCECYPSVETQAKRVDKFGFITQLVCLGFEAKGWRKVSVQVRSDFSYYEFEFYP